jgi:glutathione S-transferase
MRQEGVNMSRTLELWQTEWCPASHRVRQRLTELGLSYTVHQVAVQRDDRAQLEAATGRRTIPILVAGGEVIEGEQAILAHLEEHFNEPPDALGQRAKAAMAKQRELEEACPKLAAATH